MALSAFNAGDAKSMAIPLFFTAAMTTCLPVELVTQASMQDHNLSLLPIPSLCLQGTAASPLTGNLPFLT